MTEIDTALLAQTVVWWTFAISVVAGLAMSRSDFCTMGALSDIFSMGDWTRLRMWFAAIGVAIIGMFGFNGGIVAVVIIIPVAFISLWIYFWIVVQSLFKQIGEENLDTTCTIHRCYFSLILAPALAPALYCHLKN